MKWAIIHNAITQRSILILKWGNIIFQLLSSKVGVYIPNLKSSLVLYIALTNLGCDRNSMFWVIELALIGFVCFLLSPLESLLLRHQWRKLSRLLEKERLHERWSKVPLNTCMCTQMCLTLCNPMDCSPSSFYQTRERDHLELSTSAGVPVNDFSKGNPGKPSWGISQPTHRTRGKYKSVLF